VAEVKYGKAIKRLEEILQKIEDEEVDVDELADRVKEAVQLIRVCKDKIERAQADVSQVVEDFETEKNNRSSRSG